MATEAGKRHPHRNRNDFRRKLRFLRENPLLAQATLDLEAIEVCHWLARIERDPTLRAMADGTDPLAEDDDFQARVDQLASAAHVLARRLDGSA